MMDTGILFRKHTYEILDVLFLRDKYFQDIVRDVGISAKVLSERTIKLREMGLVTRTLEDGPPVRSRYGITPRGKRIFRLLMQLRNALNE